MTEGFCWRPSKLLVFSRPWWVKQSRSQWKTWQTLSFSLTGWAWPSFGGGGQRWAAARRRTCCKEEFCGVMRTCTSCNCYYCQTQIEKHNLSDASHQLSLCGKTCPRCRELSVDTQCNWGGGGAAEGSQRRRMNTWSERFYVLGDDLISHNVYFTAGCAINLHDREPKCDIFI